ncbi:MAG TPA: AAA family ATPase [Polyangia bacterium]|nr:AAA family ATPase [Polyangia bacterium]
MTSDADRAAWPPAWARDLVPRAADVDQASLYLAIEAGGWPAADLPRAERRAFALVVLASLESRGAGATRLGLATVGERVARLGATDDDRAAAARLAGAGLAGAALAPFVGQPGDYRPFIVDGGFLYHERDLRLEMRLAAALATRLSAPEVAPTATDPKARWTDEQAAAIAAARRRSLTVISGGPGTGKTALIGGIVQAWIAAGIDRERIAIAAPTGKAANRIAELLATDDPAAPAPGTLHRLLGLGGGALKLGGGEFRHHENRPLPYAAVIVDEASMVGLALMEQLSRALLPDARLVLIGDGDQLPAVEAGSVFRDLVGVGSALRLTRSHRMNPDDPAGARVLDVARAIAAGDLAGRGAPAARAPSELTFTGFECLEPDGDAAPVARRTVATFIDRWYAEWIRPGADAARQSYALRAGSDAQLDPDAAAAVAFALGRQQRSRLLTVTRRGFAGADRINAELARRAAADAGLPAPPPGAILPGTPVMITRNDYDRGLYNGDQGVVLSVVPAGGGRPVPAAVFPRGGALVPFPLPALQGALAVAYASTVHKAQGSELDRAALILPDTDLPLLSRELVYTAVTRVRHSITVVGRRALLEQAAARPLERSSGLAERIATMRTR